MKSVRQHAYVRPWLRPAALLVSLAAHAAAVSWVLRSAATESMQAPPPAAVMVVDLQVEPPAPEPVAPKRAKAPRPAEPAPPVAPISFKPVEVGSAAGEKAPTPQTPMREGWLPNAGLQAQIRQPVAGTGGKDGADALRNWCGGPPTGSAESAPGPVKRPPVDADADIVVVNCECLVTMVRPYKLNGEQMALYITLVDPGQGRNRFHGMVATYRSKHGRAKTDQLLDTFDEMNGKLDLCTGSAGT